MFKSFHILIILLSLSVKKTSVCEYSEILLVTSPCIANMENSKKLPEVLSGSAFKIVNLNNETGKVTAKCQLCVGPQSGIISGSLKATSIFCYTLG